MNAHESQRRAAIAIVPVQAETEVHSTPADLKHSNKKLSCRKETVRLLRGSVLAKYNGKIIFCGHYRSIFNHCDVIGGRT